jgi:hypothetical protein
LNEETIRTALVDLLAVLLRDGTTARLLFDDLKPAPNTKFAEQRHRIAVTRLLGNNEHAVESFLSSLVGCQGSNGRTLRRRGDESEFYVS